MPDVEQIAKATLQEIGWDENGEPQEVDGAQQLTVQFNPATLKVSFSNQKAGGDQPGGSAIQYVGRGTTKLTIEMRISVGIM